MRLLREKLMAAAIHAIFTLMVGLLTAIVVFQVWYPGGLAEMLGGSELYKLVLLVEVGLGPLISLVIYNSAKGRAELIRDYVVVALIQFSALAYGLYTVSISRPVFMVFVKDRIEVVSSSELSDTDLRAAVVDDYKNLSWTGPKQVCYERPEDQEELNDILFSSVEGKDVHLMPKYYRECEAGEMARFAISGEELFLDLPARQVEMVGLDGKDFLWLPMVGNRKYWTAVFPSGDSDNAEYYNIDPY